MDEDVERIKGLLAPPLQDAGFHLETVKAVAAGPRRTLTVVVDLDESSTDPMSMEKIAESTKIVGDALDEVEIFRDKPYQLEVTSPGATRKLETPATSAASSAGAWRSRRRRTPSSSTSPRWGRVRSRARTPSARRRRRSTSARSARPRSN
jgi:hypothetical protein